MNSLLALVLMMAGTVHADSQVCSQYVGQNPKMTRALEFLKRYEGRYAFGKCEIELHVCGEFSAADDRGDMVADLLVVDARGREFYAPIYFLQATSDRFWYELQNGRIMFHYKYEDRLPNPLTLGVESVHLEILSQWDNPALKSVHLGYYLKADFAGKSHKNRYQWTVCKD